MLVQRCVAPRPGAYPPVPTRLVSRLRSGFQRCSCEASIAPMVSFLGENPIHSWWLPKT